MDIYWSRKRYSCSFSSSSWVLCEKSKKKNKQPTAFEKNSSLYPWRNTMTHITQKKILVLWRKRERKKKRPNNQLNVSENRPKHPHALLVQWNIFFKNQTQQRRTHTQDADIEKADRKTWKSVPIVKGEWQLRWMLTCFVSFFSSCQASRM